MRYLHTMVRVENLEESLNFYCDILGMKKVREKHSEGGKFTLVFLAADEDVDIADESNAPFLELTYNWPDADGNVEQYGKGRNFGHLAYEVDNIYEFCQDLMDKGVVIKRPPRDGRMAFIKSPDEISIEILQKGEALELVEPWTSMANQGDW